MPQNTEKSIRNPLREGPWSLRNRSGTLPERARRQKAILGPKKATENFLGARPEAVFGAILGPGRGPQIDPKSTFGRQEGAEDRIFTDFRRFFAASALGSTPRGDFGRSEL